MSHTYHQYKQRFGQRNAIFLGSAGLYFLSLFFDHPVLCIKIFYYEQKKVEDYASCYILWYAHNGNAS